MRAMFGPPSILTAWPWYCTCPTWHAEQFRPIISVPPVFARATDTPTGRPYGLPACLASESRP